MNILLIPTSRGCLMETGVFALLCTFVIGPIIVLPFIYFMIRKQKEVEIIKYKKEILTMELEKEKVHLEVLNAENQKYDRMIEDQTKI
jgi:hypothetical protein